MSRKNKEKKSYEKACKNYVELLRKMHDMLLSSNALSEVIEPDGKLKQFDYDMVLNKSTSNVFESIPVDSDKFRLRFAEKIIDYFEENVEYIVDSVFKHSRMNTCRYENCQIILNEIAMTFARFLNQFLKPKTILKTSGTWTDDYTDSMIDLFKFIAIAKGDNAVIDLIKTFRDEQDFLPMAIQNKDDYEDEIILNDIIKLAFALTTLDPEVDVTPSYKDLCDISEDMYAQLIEVLGQCVRYSKTTNPFYVRFMTCRPEIRSKLVCSDTYIEGLQALEFLKFVMHDKTISKYVDRLIAHN